jgi:hypothetical protein
VPQRLLDFFVLHLLSCCTSAGLPLVLVRGPFNFAEFGEIKKAVTARFHIGLLATTVIVIYRLTQSAVNDIFIASSAV